jgi:propanediol utilization protein
VEKLRSVETSQPSTGLVNVCCVSTHSGQDKSTGGVLVIPADALIIKASNVFIEKRSIYMREQRISRTSPSLT